MYIAQYYDSLWRADCCPRLGSLPLKEYIYSIYNLSRKATCRLHRESPEEVKAGSETREWKLEIKTESGKETGMGRENERKYKMNEKEMRKKAEKKGRWKWETK